MNTHETSHYLALEKSDVRRSLLSAYLEHIKSRLPKWARMGTEQMISACMETYKSFPMAEQERVDLQKRIIVQNESLISPAYANVFTSLGPAIHQIEEADKAPAVDHQSPGAVIVAIDPCRTRSVREVAGRLLGGLPMVALPTKAVLREGGVKAVEKRRVDLTFQEFPQVGLWEAGGRLGTASLRLRWPIRLLGSSVRNGLPEFGS